jgi:hypothetical protein
MTHGNIKNYVYDNCEIVQSNFISIIYIGLVNVVAVVMNKF